MSAGISAALHLGEDYRPVPTWIVGIFKSMDSMVGPDFEKGLAKLKAVAEAASK